MIGQIVNIITDTTPGVLYVALCVLLSTYYLILKCRRDPRLVEFAKTVDGPVGLPLVGNSLQFAFGGLGAFGKTCAAYSAKYGSVYKFWLGKELVIGLSEIDHVKIILRNSKTLGKPNKLFTGFEEFWGNKLFTAPMPVWRQTRKKLQPIFGRNIVKCQIPSINKSIDIFVKLFENHLNGPEFNLYDYSPYLVTHAFLSSYLGVSLTFQEMKHYSFHTIFKEYVDKVVKMIDLGNRVKKDAFQKLINPWRRINVIGKLVSIKTDIFKKTFREFFESLIEKASTLEKDDCKKPDNITNFLLTTTQKLEKEMRLENYSFDETMGTITASTDTTSMILSYCLLIIAMNPEIQKKLYEESCQVMGVEGVPSTMEDLDECKYLDQVLKETLRRFTIVPNIFRYTEEDTEVGSMVIPVGVAVMARVEDIHMNPLIYPNPREFNPDNFSPEAVSQRSKYSFLPFSIGSRDCIGRIFAESTIKLVIIALLQKFKLSTTTKMKEMEYEPGYVLRIRERFQLSITFRN